MPIRNFARSGSLAQAIRKIGSNLPKRLQIFSSPLSSNTVSASMEIFAAISEYCMHSLFHDILSSIHYSFMWFTFFIWVPSTSMVIGGSLLLSGFFEIEAHCLLLGCLYSLVHLHRMGFFLGLVHSRMAVFFFDMVHYLNMGIFYSMEHFLPMVSFCPMVHCGGSGFFSLMVHFS